MQQSDLPSVEIREGLGGNDVIANTNALSLPLPDGDDH